MVPAAAALSTWGEEPRGRLLLLRSGNSGVAAGWEAAAAAAELSTIGKLAEEELEAFDGGGGGF